MPNGIQPQSNDDKNWKLATERELAELRRIINVLTAQIKAQSRS